MMPGTRSTAVVVLNWNGVNHLQTYLPSVLTHTPSDVAIWVVDNGSEDASVDWLQNNVAERVQVLELKENHGFAGATTGRWITLMQTCTFF